MALYVRPLTRSEQQRLHTLANSPDREMTKRARIVLMSSRHVRVQEISTLVDLHAINVRKWIHRFNSYGISGLSIRRSPGRPPLFEGRQRNAIVNLATCNPEALGLGFRSWTLGKLRSQLILQGVVVKISAETIRQELLRAGLVFEGRRWVPVL